MHDAHWGPALAHTTFRCSFNNPKYGCHTCSVVNLTKISVISQSSLIAFVQSTWLASIPQPSSALRVQSAQKGEGKYMPPTSWNGLKKSHMQSPKNHLNLELPLSCARLNCSFISICWGSVIFHMEYSCTQKLSLLQFQSLPFRIACHTCAAYCLFGKWTNSMGHDGPLFLSSPFWVHPRQKKNMTWVRMWHTLQYHPQSNDEPIPNLSWAQSQYCQQWHLHFHDLMPTIIAERYQYTKIIVQ